MPVTRIVGPHIAGAAKRADRRLRARSEKGSALVELVVCLPLLALTLVGTADFARIFYTSIELTNAARAGAQYGAHNLAQSVQLTNIQAAATAAVNIPFDPPQVSSLCQCFDDSGVPSAIIACTAPPTGCGGQHRVMTVTVTTTKTFTTLASLVGIPGSIALTRSATLRVSE